MSWFYIAIAKSDHEAMRGAANSLLTDFGKSWTGEGFPNGVEVWGRAGEDSSHHYLFSPEAAACAPKLMNDYRAKRCPKDFDPADAGFKRIYI
jgi:hypothetical protein